MWLRMILELLICVCVYVVGSRVEWKLRTRMGWLWIIGSEIGGEKNDWDWVFNIDRLAATAIECNEPKYIDITNVLSLLHKLHL